MYPIQPKYQHPVVKNYQAMFPKRSKADIEKSLLKEFGIETSLFFGPSISVDSPLSNEGNRERLLNHLNVCNFWLNTEYKINAVGDLIDKTITVLRTIFPNKCEVDIYTMVEDIHYLMSHRNLIHDSKFPNHAQYLRKALIGNSRDDNEEAMMWPDGIKYVGEWNNGVPSGKGTMTWTDGKKYVGEWNNGVPSGIGTMMWPDGKKYVGEWNDGVRKGKGVMIWPDKEKYTGNWDNGVPSGKGVLIYDNEVIKSDEWSRGCLPVHQIPVPNLETLSILTNDSISLARNEFRELLQQSPEQANNLQEIPAQVYPKIEGNKRAYIVAIDPIRFRHDSKRRKYGPDMFDKGQSDPCNSSNLYLNGFFSCARELSRKPASELYLEDLREALSTAFPKDYTQLNLSETRNPTHPAMYYYDFEYRYSTAHMMEYGLFYPLERVMPYSNCRYVDINKISPEFLNEDVMEDAFQKYKNDFLNKVKNANKNQIKAAIILFISQIEGTHFFNNGNNRLSCQILLNKLLVEYEVYDDKLGSILFIPNGFSHYALSHLNYYLQTTNKTLNGCTVQDLELALKSAAAWVDFGHECYQKLVSQV